MMENYGRELSRFKTMVDLFDPGPDFYFAYNKNVNVDGWNKSNCFTDISDPSALQSVALCNDSNVVYRNRIQ